MANLNVAWLGAYILAIAPVGPESHPALEKFEFFDGKRVLLL